MRRKDRQITDEAWIRAYLNQAKFGVLAMSDQDQPFININLFVFDEEAHAIYWHNARTGRTPAIIEVNQRVCFGVGEMGRLLPADEALEFSVEYQSVILFGSATLVTDKVEATQALQLLLIKYFPHLQSGEDYRPITSDELKRTGVYRLDIEQWSAKQKKAPPDFPGAFFYQSDSKPE